MKASSLQRPRTQHKPSRRTATVSERSRFSAYLPSLIRALAVALPITLAAGLLLALLAAALLASLPDPDTPLVPIGLAILLLSALLLGLLIGIRTKDRLLFGGIAGGVILLLAMLVLSFPLASNRESWIPSSLGLPLRCTVLLFTSLGCYLGGLFPARRSARHPRTKR